MDHDEAAPDTAATLTTNTGSVRLRRASSTTVPDHGAATVRPQCPMPRSEAATNVYSQAPYTSSPATVPGTPAVSSQYYQPLRPPDSMIQSRYRAAEPPQQLDLVTLVLAFLAFIAVMLLIPLWIAVYQAWAG